MSIFNKKHWPVRLRMVLDVRKNRATLSTLKASLIPCNLMKIYVYIYIANHDTDVCIHVNKNESTTKGQQER